MDGFTTGAAFLAYHSILSAFFVIPIMYAIWLGIAISLRKKQNKFFDYSYVKRRINMVYLPICIIAFAAIVVFVMPSMFAFFGHRGPSLWHRANAIWISAFPTLGMYVVARTVAAVSNMRLTRKGLVFSMFLASIPLGILGIIISLGVSEAGVSIVLFLIFVALHAFYVELSNRERVQKE